MRRGGGAATTLCKMIVLCDVCTTSHRFDRPGYHPQSTYITTHVYYYFEYDHPPLMWLSCGIGYCDQCCQSIDRSIRLAVMSVLHPPPTLSHNKSIGRHIVSIII